MPVRLDARFVLVLLALCLGSAAAWATTGVFRFTFFPGLLLGIAVSVGIVAHWKLCVGLSPAFVLLGWLSQTSALAWQPVWLALIMIIFWICNDTTTIIRKLPQALTRYLTPARLRSLAYGVLILVVLLGGIPVWCLLVLLTWPLVWGRELPNITERLNFAMLVALWCVVGHLITGLIR